MDKNKEPKVKQKTEVDESEKVGKKLKIQRKTFEQDLELEEMLEELDDSVYYMVKNIK